MTDIDSAYLLKLARDKSVERRRLLTEIIADLFQGDGKVLTERERALMFNIMHKMVRDAELSIRQIIGQRLADVPDVPHELALFTGQRRHRGCLPYTVRSHRPPGRGPD